MHGGKTVDQVLADAIGQDTPLPSIEVCIEEVALNCGAGYGCSYYNTISWKNDTLPLPMENSPQVVFERLFGDGTNAAQRLSRKQQDKSILDSVTDKVSRLQSGLDAGDRARLGEYLDNVREIERRIQKATQQSANNPNVPEAPVGVPEAFEDHIKLMYDLQALAYQAEITRISTMMYARDTSGAVYPGSGVRDGFHTASHHSNARARMDTFAQINRYHVQMLGYFLEKLKATPDGDGTLLDHSVVLYGSSMSNGNQHDHDPLPILVAGGASGQLKGDRHLVVPGAHADVEPDAVAARQAGRAPGPLRRQHREAGDLIADTAIRHCLLARSVGGLGAERARPRRAVFARPRRRDRHPHGPRGLAHRPVQPPPGGLDRAAGLGIG